MTWLITLIDRLKQSLALQFFTIYTRYLIGAAFVIAAFGMGKFNNQELLISSPGVPIDQLHPLQQFFRVMATSGLYWKFIGWSQLVAGGLLMTQRFSKLGAAIFFGLILNIFIITVSYDFKGTPIITGLMLMASLYLILWDFNSFQFLFRRPQPELCTFPKTSIHDKTYWSWVGLLMLVSIVALHYLNLNVIVQLATCFSIGLASFVIYLFLALKISRQASA